MKHYLIFSLFILFASFVESTDKVDPKLIPISYKIKDCSDLNLPEDCIGYTFTVPKLFDLYRHRNVIFMARRLNDSVATYCLYLEKNGTLTAIQETERVPFTLITTGHGYGEPCEIIVVAANQKNKPVERLTEIATCKIISHPLEVIDEQQHKFSLETITKEGTVFKATIFNATPQEFVTAKILSGEEETISMHQADKNGKVVFMISPAISGKKSGSFEVTISSASITTPLIISHFWGSLAFTPTSKYNGLKK